MVGTWVDRTIAIAVLVICCLSRQELLCALQVKCCQGWDVLLLCAVEVLCCYLAQCVLRVMDDRLLGKVCAMECACVGSK
jgi:hypothetical protein